MNAVAAMPAMARRRSSVLRDIWPMLPGLVVLVLIFALPLALILPESFLVKGKASLEIYESILGDSYYWTVLARSFWLSLLSTMVCLVLGYPVAYYLTRIAAPQYKRYVYMIVIAPLFTSAVIRAMAWLLILGRKGLINDALKGIGVIDAPLRLLYTENAVIVGLVYIMIPFMVLTIAAVLENIDSSLEEAARDLGATPWETFLRVTFPLTLPGVLAGSFLVFSLCLSSYVTPALLGGGRVMMWSMQIERNVTYYADWGAASSLGVVLLVITLAILWVFGRIIGFDKLSGGAR